MPAKRFLECELHKKEAHGHTDFGLRFFWWVFCGVGCIAHQEFPTQM